MASWRPISKAINLPPGNWAITWKWRWRSGKSVLLASRFAHENDCRLPLVQSELQVAVAALFGHPNRPQIVRTDDAGSPRRREVRIAPLQRGPRGLRRVALSVSPRRQHPSDFRRFLDWRLHVSLVIRESHLADEVAGILFLHHPIAEAQQRPMTHVTQQPGPRFFLGERLPPELPAYNG